jgi:hypothetical protein
MDEQEARGILAAEIERLRSQGYPELRRLIDPNRETRQVAGPSGTEYNLEVGALFDDGGEAGNIRVMVSIDDGRGLRAFVPLTTDFIMAPDGTFVGE